MSEAIEIRNFSKRYGEVQAVENLSLEVAYGELFGLIGPDGAGKTTTMRTVCTLLRCEQGEIRVDGRDVRTEVGYIRSILGYMPQRFSLYPDLSVEQNLDFFAELFGVPEAEKKERLERLYAFSKLEPFKGRLAGALSGGMKQKLALSCTLIHTPRILVLDEPTTGVDPVSRQEFWSILKTLQAEGVTIFVSTPYMDETLLCDRVAFMYKGRVLAVDRPDRLAELFPGAVYEAAGPEPRKLLAYFAARNEVRSVQLFGDRLHVYLDRPLSAAEADALQARAPAAVEWLQPIRPGVEDVFLHLMKTSEKAES